MKSPITALNHIALSSPKPVADALREWMETYVRQLWAQAHVVEPAHPEAVGYTTEELLLRIGKEAAGQFAHVSGEYDLIKNARAIRAHMLVLRGVIE